MENNQSRCEIMTIADVCSEFKISRTSVYEAMNGRPTGEVLKAFKVGRCTRLRRTDVEAWFASRPAFASPRGTGDSAATK